MRNDEIVCPKCGSIYTLTSQHIPVREKDSIDCEVCDQKKIFSWNEARDFTAILKEKKENYKK